MLQAWNVKPKSSHNKWRPSAEFVESALIFTYGATNIFLEHLGNAGKEFRPQDLEHISITVLFIGGGLVSSYSINTFQPAPLLTLGRYSVACSLSPHAFEIFSTQP